MHGIAVRGELIRLYSAFKLPISSIKFLGEMESENKNSTYFIKSNRLIRYKFILKPCMVLGPDILVSRGSGFLVQVEKKIVIECRAFT